jgi:hypothetical protein
LIVAWIEAAHAITHAASIGSNQSRSNEAYGRTILKTQPSQATAGAQLQSANSLLLMGEIAESRRHYDRAIALYDPAAHRPLATRFGQDARVAILSLRSLALWLLGYPEAALSDADGALKDAREIGHAATLMFALNEASYTRIYCGKFAAATRSSMSLSLWQTKKAPCFGEWAE